MCFSALRLSERELLHCQPPHDPLPTQELRAADWSLELREVETQLGEGRRLEAVMRDGFIFPLSNPLRAVRFNAHTPFGIR